MIGRGIDQILPYPSDPERCEDAHPPERYLDLAQARYGPIPHPTSFEYVWGDALAELAKCDMRIANLETSLTRSGDAWPKRVRYRMNPANIACISHAGIDCCSLANNHVLDFGSAGLLETLQTLRRNRIAFAGAGNDEAEAAAPLVHEIAGKARVLVFGLGSVTSGIPLQWAADRQKPGINMLTDLSTGTADRIADRMRTVKQPGDVLVVSVHWGANFGYEIPAEQRMFAHRLIERGNVDIVHGHSSHHIKAIETYLGKLVLYGCGDFVNDYEGIPGYEEFRDDLALLYAVEVRPVDGRTTAVRMIPFQIRRFTLNRAVWDDVLWLCETLRRESAPFGANFTVTEEGVIKLEFDR